MDHINANFLVVIVNLPPFFLTLHFYYDIFKIKITMETSHIIALSIPVAIIVIVIINVIFYKKE